MQLDKPCSTIKEHMYITLLSDNVIMIDLEFQADLLYKTYKVEVEQVMQIIVLCFPYIPCQL